jgi:fumarylacetoacetate (FAA) hydrolase
MKLASLKNGTRDGALCVVSRNLKLATIAYDVAPTLQAALDDWDYCAPLLGTLYEEANRQPQGSRWFELDPTQLAAPLPRAFQWIGASAYPSHMERLRKARGMAMPENSRKEPWLLQGRSDNLIGARDDIAIESTDLGLDLEAEIAIVTGDVPQGVKREKASEHIRLFMLANDWTARELVSTELTRGAGLFHSKLAVAFSPVAITPDELGSAWDGRRVQLELEAHLNDTLLGTPHAGTDMQFDFSTLIAAAARQHPLSAGTIIGSGAVSNSEASVGVCSISEKRALEQFGESANLTPFLAFGDRVAIDMRNASDDSLFGRIEQRVVQTQGRRKPAGETGDTELSEAVDAAN